MSGTLKPLIAVLFDHELRDAAAALQKTCELLRLAPGARGEVETAQAYTTALNLANAALNAIRPNIDAIVVIKLEEALTTGWDTLQEMK